MNYESLPLEFKNIFDILLTNKKITTNFESTFI